MGCRSLEFCLFCEKKTSDPKTYQSKVGTLKTYNVKNGYGFLESGGPYKGEPWWLVSPEKWLATKIQKHKKHVKKITKLDLEDTVDGRNPANHLGCKKNPS